MPVTGKAVFNQDERASWFSHKAETATPYYYKVSCRSWCSDRNCPTESGCFPFHFPWKRPLLCSGRRFDKGSFVKVIPSENKIIGYTHQNSGGVPANFKTTLYLVFDKTVYLYAAAVASGGLTPTNWKRQTTCRCIDRFQNPQENR